MPPEQPNQKEKLPLSVDGVKAVRKDIQHVVTALQNHAPSREISLAITNLQQGKMWMGMELGRMGEKDLNAERDSK